jgi:hypothetical protein
MKTTLLLLLFTLVFSTSFVHNPIYNNKETGIIYDKNDNSTIELWDNIIKYTIEILTIVGLVFGLSLGFPFLKRKLKEQQASKIIDDIFKANKVVKRECISLIDKYIFKTHESYILNKSELETILKDIMEIERHTFNSNSQVITLTFLSKKLIQILIKNYKIKQTISISSREIYNILIDLLSEIEFFATFVVNLKGFQFKSFKYAKKELRPYTSDYKFKKYKKAPQGLVYSSTSVITLKFFQIILKTNNYLISRSAYKIIGESSPIVRFLYLKKIYFPVVLESNEDSPFWGDHALFLVDFNFSTQLNSANNVRKIVKLTYSNLVDNYQFTKILKKDDIINKYHDGYISSEGVDLSKITSLSKHNPESLCFVLEEAYLNDVFVKNIKKIRRKMKDEIKNNLVM